MVWSSTLQLPKRWGTSSAIARCSRLKSLIVVDKLLRMDSFVCWPGRSGQKRKILEEIRCSLDRASVFWEMMTPDDFLKRWGNAAGDQVPLDTRKARKSAREARAAIQAAQKKSR